MLDPWIIEEIRRREEEERAEREQRPIVQIPLETPQFPSERDRVGERGPKEDRGVTIVDFTI
jgi:hypothetical protein